MTKVRQLDAAHDWTYGKGQNDYATANKAVAQNINTRLNSFLGNCFFDLAAGIDWFNLLGEKNQTALNLAISAVILNTQNVTGILQLSITLSPTRNLTVVYQVQTSFSRVSNIFQFDTNGIG
jgi:cell division FtsZ-interacting protein ZapD